MVRLPLLIIFNAALIFSVACRTNESPEGQVKDARVATTVKAKLASNLSPATLTNVSVNVTNGVVTMSGQVNNGENKQRAAEIARAVDGVVRVNDDLQIQTTP